MAYVLATALRNAIMQKYVDFLDANTNPGKLNFYTSPKPANGAAITSQTLIGTCVLSKPSGTVTNGILTLATVSDDVNVDASGTVAWCRAVDGADNFVADLDCGTSGSDITFNTLVAIAGKTLKVTGGTLTEGNT